jgi:hypothetical protein
MDVIPGRALRANPESRAVLDAGFRVCAEEAHPGMTREKKAGLVRARLKVLAM